MIIHQHGAKESQRQAIQGSIDATKSASERNRLGQFATPHALAIEIAEFVRSQMDTQDGEIHFADPSIGTGSFFSAALSVFGAAGIQSALGMELDPSFVNAARDLWSGAGLKVISGDFTRIIADDSRPPAPNLILANPPYVRHHHLKRAEKERLKRLTLEMTGVEISGLAGLYVYFLLLATAWMEDDGIAAWLIPSEFMDVNYGAQLKQFLCERVTLIRAHRFDPDDVQFGDALVSSAVLVFKKRLPSAEQKADFSFGGSLARPRACDFISLAQLRDSRKWTAYPTHAKNDRTTVSHANGPILGELFRVQRGIATGDNKFFILAREEAKRLKLPEEYLRPILPSPRFLKETVIDAGDDGYPLLDKSLCVIDCDLPEPLLQKHHPALWGYLQTAESLGVKDGYLVSKRTPWYKQEQREASPFLCTYMGRGSDLKQPFRFIWNRSQAIGTNLYLMLYPLKRLKAMFLEFPERIEEAFDLLRQVTGNELRGEGRVYGGGLNKIEPSELGRVSAQPFVNRWPELKNVPSKQGTLFA